MKKMDCYSLIKNTEKIEFTFFTYNKLKLKHRASSPINLSADKATKTFLNSLSYKNFIISIYKRFSLYGT